MPVSQEEDRQAELYAAFEALGGQLTWDELTRLLGSDEYRPALVWQVMLLLGGGPSGGTKASAGKPDTTRCSPFHTDNARLSCCTPIWACPRSKPRR